MACGEAHSGRERLVVRRQTPRVVAVTPVRLDHEQLASLDDACWSGKWREVGSYGKGGCGWQANESVHEARRESKVYHSALGYFTKLREFGLLARFWRVWVSSKGSLHDVGEAQGVDGGSECTNVIMAEDRRCVQDMNQAGEKYRYVEQHKRNRHEDSSFAAINWSVADKQKEAAKKNDGRRAQPSGVHF